MNAAEGSSPVCTMASMQDTTGVLDQGMCLRRELGDWGDPGAFLARQGEVSGKDSEQRTNRR
ncbi:hypothetical protein ACFL0M_15440 [Thermodesulfobacteriota bacterium]